MSYVIEGSRTQSPPEKRKLKRKTEYSSEVDESDGNGSDSKTEAEQNEENDEENKEEMSEDEVEEESSEEEEEGCSDEEEKAVRDRKLDDIMDTTKIPRREKEYTYNPFEMVGISDGISAQEESYPWNSKSLLKLMDGDHQWIPTEFDVSEDGKSKIVSYINNLPREKHESLYGDIEKVFDKALPHFKEVLKHVSPHHDSDGNPIYFLQPSSNDYFYVAADDWNPKRLQVIVKAANYVIQPGQTYTGNWHVEGTPMERIVASAIYYYHNSSNLEDDGLAFRNLKEKEDYGEGRTAYGGVNLGAFRTVEDRMIVFANNIQHRVTRITNPSEEVGHRKILCFFLVQSISPNNSGMR